MGSEKGTKEWHSASNTYIYIRDMDMECHISLE